MSIRTGSVAVGDLGGAIRADVAQAGYVRPFVNIWHIALAERWSDEQVIGHRTFCGRNFPNADS